RQRLPCPGRAESRDAGMAYWGGGGSMARLAPAPCPAEGGKVMGHRVGDWESCGTLAVDISTWHEQGCLFIFVLVPYLHVGQAAAPACKGSCRQPQTFPSRRRIAPQGCRIRPVWRGSEPG